MMSEPRSEQTARAELTAGDVADAVGGSVDEGVRSLKITGMAGLREARPGELSFVADKRYARLAAKTGASALLVSDELELPPGCKAEAVIRVPDIQAGLDRVTGLFAPPEPPVHEGIHPSAVIGRDVALGRNVSVGACAVIEDNARVGDNTVVGPQVFVGHGSVIGSDTRLAAGVKICNGCRVGDRVVLHPGVVLGGDGFGYVFADGVHKKIPQIGRVVIEDDVEIGSNTTIDRARFGATRVGRGTKIDNLVQIGHNVQIGEHCIITAQCGIAGSTSLGDYVMLGAETGVVGHIHIGDRAMIGAKSGVSKDVPAGASFLGVPARPATITRRIMAATGKLPELMETTRNLGKRVDKLEEEAGN